jgi:hypothetical protein
MPDRLGFEATPMDEPDDEFFGLLLIAVAFVAVAPAAAAWRWLS